MQNQTTVCYANVLCVEAINIVSSRMSAHILNVGPYRIKTRKSFGRGTFGEVYLGKHRETGWEVAAKKIDLGSKDDLDESKPYAMKEVEAMLRVKHHPYILQLIHHQFVDDEEEDVHELWLISEFCEGGNLSAYNKSHQLAFKDKVRISRQCASAIAFLHNLEPNVVHRDIKPGNILLKDVDGMDTVKIADFGLAKNTSKTMSTVGGSWHYMAPELYQPNARFQKSVDVYALGVLKIHLIKVKPEQELECEEGRLALTFFFQKLTLQIIE